MVKGVRERSEVTSVNSRIVTVADLVSITGLEVRVIAGEAGLDREITWAHSCEQPDPETWLDTDELLMTIGIGVPQGDAEQVEYLRKISEAGLSGLMAGIDERLPTLSDAMLDEANERDFPILLVPKHIPFVAVSRHIASLTQDSQTAQVLLLAKLYGLTAAEDREERPLSEKLAEILNIGISVNDEKTGFELFNAAAPTGDGTSTDEARTRKYPLNTRRPTRLTITEPEQRAVSSMVLVHVRNILEVDVDRRLGRLHDRIERGKTALTLTTSTDDTTQVEHLLAGADLTQGIRTVAFPEHAAEEVALAGSIAGAALVVGTHRGHGFAIIPECDVPHLKSVTRRLDVPAGASAIYDSFADHKGSFAQAEDALDTAVRDRTAWIEYEGVEILVMSRSRSEARRIIDDVLGPLAEDTTRAASLRETLFAYLRNNRKWTETAEELGIHRQTLAYRLRQIEASIGRTLSDTGDLAALWVAMQSWDVRSPAVR